MLKTKSNKIFLKSKKIVSYLWVLNLYKTNTLKLSNSFYKKKLLELCSQSVFHCKSYYTVCSNKSNCIYIITNTNV